MTDTKELGLYIHIPFCKKKCDYCDFLSFSEGREFRNNYVQALIREIQLTKSTEEWNVGTIFIGGGTPSIINEEEITGIMKAVYERYTVAKEAEITIEANPGTLTKDKLLNYRRLGINRISLGLQSTVDRELKLLGRIHSYQEFKESFSMARASGFANINVDLMSALPGQTLRTWEETLSKIAELRPEHISAYSLIIEEGTPFYERYEQDMRLRERGQESLTLPSEETERNMYQSTRKILEASGYRQYEISNYAMPGWESRHNSDCWKRKNYRGYGLGAASLVHNTRFRNTDILGDYMKGEHSPLEKEVLNTQEQMEETMFLGLRMRSGVSMVEFEENFGVPFLSIYKKTMEKLHAQGLIEMERDRVLLTDKGIDLSNYAFSEFLLST